MPLRFKDFVATLLMSMMPVTTLAQSVSESARNAPFSDAFVAGFEIQRIGNRVVEIYSPQRERPIDEPHWRARQSFRVPDGRDEQIWIDSKGCPALASVAAVLDSIPSPGLSVPSPLSFSPPAPQRFVSTEGANYVVWGRARQSDGSFAEVTMSANLGPLADTVATLDAALKPCWVNGSPTS